MCLPEVNLPARAPLPLTDQTGPSIMPTEPDLPNAPPHERWFIDAMNVIGSRPDGWWRDREGAIRRFVDTVRAWAPGGDEVTVVLDAGPDDVLGDDGAIAVVRAAR